MDDHIILKLEIARLLRIQREQQLAECNNVIFHTLEYGAQKNYEVQQLSETTIQLLKDPMANPTIQSTVHTLKSSLNHYNERVLQILEESRNRLSFFSASSVAWFPSSTIGTVLSSTSNHTKKTIETEDLRTVTKIEMLEAQLADLKRLLEAQSQLAALGALQALATANTVTNNNTPPTQSTTTVPSSSSTVPDIVSSSSSSIPPSSRPLPSTTTTAPVPPSRPNMVNILSGINNASLRKTTDTTTVATTASKSNASSMDTTSSSSNGGLSNLLKHALDKRFAQIHHQSSTTVHHKNTNNVRRHQLASPSSNYSSDSGSDFGSPVSTRSTALPKYTNPSNTTIMTNAVNMVHRRLSRKLSNLVPSSSMISPPSSSLHPTTFDLGNEDAFQRSTNRILQRTFSTTAVPLPNAMQQSIPKVGEICENHASTNKVSSSSLSSSSSSSMATLPRALQQLQSTKRQANKYANDDDNDSVVNWSDDEDNTDKNKQEKNSKITTRSKMATGFSFESSSEVTIPIAPVATSHSLSLSTTKSLPVAMPVVSKPQNLLGAIQGFSKTNLKKTVNENDSNEPIETGVLVQTNTKANTSGSTVGMTPNDTSTKHRTPIVQGNAPVNFLDSIKNFKKDGLKKLSENTENISTSTAAPNGNKVIKNSTKSATTNLPKVSAPATSGGGFSISDIGKVQLRRTGTALK